MSTQSSATRNQPPKPDWYHDLAEYQDRSWKRGLLQIADSILPYLAIMTLMFVSVERGWPYWSTLLIAVPAAMFLVRTFMIFHDCTHGSYFPSNRANRITGFVTGVLTFTAFEPWRLSHLKHHATNGQLDHRGFGDVTTMTYEEYRDASRWQRFLYRAYRNPLVMFLVGSFYTFVVINRFVGLRGTPAERRSVIATDVALVAIAATLSVFFGFGTYVAIQLPVIFFAGVMGIWLFYVQHQFDPSYWARDDEWDQIDAALHGASYYRLPAILRWFTGNIGVHHVHHLRPRIPSYRLYDAYASVPQTHVEKPLTFWRSLGAVRYNLWNEVSRRFMSFREAGRMLRLERRSARPATGG
jgi:acyl-lipid omega-6 desaturase (Delta-12 desaturase)